eukprot:TRINITY_DN985_c0_g1_i1.p1 TRINITY_DN985_c0_g1~~TRINITY_DN985_c0_g1_i1.p1  ORF type:complete len:741 (+),score=202.83 TRINITY_DN985_c0_g1_i1:31-2223(+)
MEDDEALDPTPTGTLTRSDEEEEDSLSSSPSSSPASSSRRSQSRPSSAGGGVRRSVLSATTTGTAGGSNGKEVVVHFASLDEHTRNHVLNAVIFQRCRFERDAESLDYNTTLTVPVAAAHLLLSEQQLQKLEKVRQQKITVNSSSSSSSTSYSTPKLYQQVMREQRRMHSRASGEFKTTRVPGRNAPTLRPSSSSLPAGSGLRKTLSQAYSGFVECLSPQASEFSVHPVQWASYCINAIYDQRYAWENTDQTKRKTDTFDASRFPFFVNHWFAKRYGLKAITDRHCWDFLYNVDKYRDTSWWVNVFARFLEEHYGEDDLSFLLYARGIVQDCLAKDLALRRSKTASQIVAHARPPPSRKGGAESSSGDSAGIVPCYLSFAQCDKYCARVFGSQNAALANSFAVRLREFAKKHEIDPTRGPELCEVYYLLVVHFRTTRPHTPTPGNTPCESETEAGDTETVSPPTSPGQEQKNDQEPAQLERQQSEDEPGEAKEEVPLPSPAPQPVRVPVPVLALSPKPLYVRTETDVEVKAAAPSQARRVKVAKLQLHSPGAMPSPVSTIDEQVSNKATSFLAHAHSSFSSKETSVERQIFEALQAGIASAMREYVDVVTDEDGLKLSQEKLRAVRAQIVDRLQCAVVQTLEQICCYLSSPQCKPASVPFAAQVEQVLDQARALYDKSGEQGDAAGESADAAKEEEKQEQLSAVAKALGALIVTVACTARISHPSPLHSP